MCIKATEVDLDTILKGDDHPIFRDNLEQTFNYVNQVLAGLC